MIFIHFETKFSFLSLEDFINFLIYIEDEISNNIETITVKYNEIYFIESPDSIIFELIYASLIYFNE